MRYCVTIYLYHQKEPCLVISLQYQSSMLYTLNLHSVMCQLYLNKAGKKNFVHSLPKQPHLISKSKENGQEKQHN